MPSTHNSSHSEHSHSSDNHHSHHSHHHSHSKSSSSSNSKKSSKKKRKFKHSLRRPISHLVSVFLTLFVFIFFSLIAILCTAFSDSYITKALTSEEYVAQLYDAQLTEATALASEYNLPKSIYNNVITQDVLKQHLTEYVDSVLSGRTKSSDLTAMQKNLMTNIESAVEDSGAKLDEKAKNTITNFVGTFGEKYFSLMEINNLSTITGLKIPFIIIFVICEILLALLIPILSLLVDRSHRNTHKTTRQLAYSFLGAGALTFAVPFLMRFLNVYGTLQAWREYVYHFFMSYFNHIMNVWMLFSIIPFAMGAGFIVWTRYRKNKLKVKV